MDRVCENRGVTKKPESLREMGNRRALRDLKNLGGPPPHPCSFANRRLTRKSYTEDKNPTFIARRPITRSFAATLAIKPHACQPESKENYEQIGNEQKHMPVIPTAVSSRSLVIPTAIDVEEHKSSDDLPSTMADEIQEMDVEMEDLMAERIQDIDICDRGEPLAVVDYVKDIYSFYRHAEAACCVSDYMSTQLDINEKMRAILIDWLMEVHHKLELMDETLFLTVNIIDRFLEQQTVVRKKLQLVGVTAMFLACKYEEVSVPVVEDLIIISDGAYTRDEILSMEMLIINTLKFNMSVPTPYVFMRRFLKAAQSDKKLELLSFFIIELCLVDYKMLKFKPSLLAAAAIYTAQFILKGFKQWTKTCELHTSYSEGQLLECSMLMVDLHKAGTRKLAGYGFVANKNWLSYSESQLHECPNADSRKGWNWEA